MDKDFTDKIPSSDRTQPPKPVGDEGPQQAPEKAFGDYMNAPVESQPPQGMSPYDLSKQTVPQTQAPTMDSVQSQMKSASGALGDVQNQLNTKNLTLKQSQKYLLRNKLSEANTHIRTAASKAGVDVGPPPSANTRQNPIRKYLAYVTDSQDQLNSAQDKIKEIAASGNTLSAGQMLLIQVKLNKAQQAIEYSSVLLSKAVDDIKMLFNVQI